MPNSFTFLPSRGEVQARYVVRLLADAQPASEGLVHLTADGEQHVDWGDVQYVLAAEIGEPQGIRIVVFDLVVASGDGTWSVLRLDEEPGEDAEAVAQVLTAAIPAQRLGAAVKSLATESVLAEWFPDVPSYEEAAVAVLEKLS